MIWSALAGDMYWLLVKLHTKVVDWGRSAHSWPLALSKNYGCGRWEQRRCSCRRDDR